VSTRWARHLGLAAVVLLGTVVGACASSGGARSSGPLPGATSVSVAPGPSAGSPATTSVDPSTTSADPTASSTAVTPSVRERLAVLNIDDRPSPVGSYRRDDWPHWKDPDGNGCDARQDTLIRWSTSPATVDRSRGCKVLAGTWVSPYDGLVTASPAEIQIDHMVPLAEAFRSGGWQWDAGRRRQFANDPIELVAASSGSNNAKSDSPPNEWRPGRTEAWCAYADRWVTVKATYGLTVTSSERDALGQMLDTCTLVSERWP
jgi:hypothetical protein